MPLARARASITWRHPSAKQRLALLGLAAALAGGAAEAGEARPVCANEPTIVVLGRSHRLLLCARGTAARSFSVSLGRGGLGKRSAGDGKTPLGTYALGLPRPSKEFGTFIPIGYPTRFQRAAGFTGSDIGVHGPKRNFRWLGRVAGVVDWTRGCIALNREADIEDIARWAADHHTERIEIRDE